MPHQNYICHDMYTFTSVFVDMNEHVVSMFLAVTSPSGAAGQPTRMRHKTCPSEGITTGMCHDVINCLHYCDTVVHLHATLVHYYDTCT